MYILTKTYVYPNCTLLIAHCTLFVVFAVGGYLESTVNLGGILEEAEAAYGSRILLVRKESDPDPGRYGRHRAVPLRLCAQGHTRIRKKKAL